MKVSLPLTKCISSGDFCSYRSLERGVFPCRLELGSGERVVKCLSMYLATLFFSIHETYRLNS